MKKIAMFLCSILVSASFLSSCGMVTDSIEIESVKSSFNEETRVTTITIRYLDDIEPPLVLEIPAGMQGVEGIQGVGIDRVETKLDDNGELEAIIIHFTDPEREPYTVPMRDGISINDVVSEKLEDGSIKLTFMGDNGQPVGEPIVVPAGTQIRLTPGESIHVQQYLYHDFAVEEGTGAVLLGEVSQCNDDSNDNHFNPPMGRFPAIEEDEAPYRLLCTEYPEAR